MPPDALEVLETPIDVEHLITEDDTPVDNMFSEKQQRLLTEPLYSSWPGPGPGRPFLAAANVGIFAQAHNPAIVPDMFLSLDVRPAPNWWSRSHRSYMLWEFGKPPELVLEIVSNTEGHESDTKKHDYARMGATYYVIHDPLRQVMADVLTVYRLSARRYVRQRQPRFPLLQLGLTLWDGVFEDCHDTWLRWTDAQGVVIPTGKERADTATARTEHERQRAAQAEAQAEHERQRAAQAEAQAEHERQRAERLAALLRQAGLDPEQP